MFARFMFSCFFILSCVASTGANAQNANADLYDPVAPENSAFVRVFNLSSGNVEAQLTSKLNSQRIPSGQFGGYRFVQPGSHSIRIGEQVFPLDLNVNDVKTLVYYGDRGLLLDDGLTNEPRKAQVLFYNFGANAAALTTANGRHVVVDSLPKDAVGNRLINEVKIALSAFANEQLVADFPEQLLRKGRSYTYALIPVAGELRPIVLGNSMDPSQ